MLVFYVYYFLSPAEATGSVAAAPGGDAVAGGGESIPDELPDPDVPAHHTCP